MDRAGLARVLKDILHYYAAIKPLGDVEVEIVAHDEAGHYELLHNGWMGQRRVHDCLLHVDIRDGKLWIQHDGLGDGITEELEEAGVPRSQIVLAWHTRAERVLMGTYAVD